MYYATLKKSFVCYLPECFNIKFWKCLKSFTFEFCFIILYRLDRKSLSFFTWFQGEAAPWDSALSLFRFLTMVGETGQAEIHGPHVLYSNTPESGLGAWDKMLQCSHPKPEETGGQW